MLRHGAGLGVRGSHDQRAFAGGFGLEIRIRQMLVPILDADFLDFAHRVEPIKSRQQSGLTRCRIDLMSGADQLHGRFVLTLLTLNGFDAGDVQTRFALKQPHRFAAARGGVLACVTGQNDASILIFGDLKHRVHRAHIHQAGFVDPNDLILELTMQIGVPD